MGKLFAEAVGYSGLARIDLSNNDFGNEGIKVVAQCLMFRSQLKYLNVSSCGFNIEGAYSFISNLGKNHTVETVVMDKNDLSGTRIRQKVLKDLFFNNKTLKSISFNHCNLGPTGAGHISRGLGFNLNLKSVSFAYNNFGDLGAEFFLDCFFLDSNSLEYFNLAGNSITDIGGAKLVGGLMYNQTLKVIDFRHNSLSEKTGLLLKPLVKLNTHLAKIHLEYNICRIKVIDELKEMMDKNYKRQEQRRVNDIRRQCKYLRKG